MVPPTERLYFIRDRLLARGPDRGYGTHSLILSCPVCGAAAWGRISSTLARTRYRSIDCLCPDCPHGHSPWYPAGSFFQAARLYAAGMGEEFDWANNFPPAVLEREARLHLAYALARPAKPWSQPTLEGL